MSDCGVCIGGWDGDTPEFFSTAVHKAKKPHVCSECERIIAAGEKYQRDSGKNEGEFWTFKTCLECAEIRAAFSCEGETLGGMLWEDMRERFPALNESCFEKLTTVSAKKFLRERWMEWKGLRV